MAAHKHAEVIKAWADGGELQFRVANDDSWRAVQGDPVWNKDVQYRIKPAEPERVYPVTRMSASALAKLYRDSPATSTESFLDVANTALRHAIDAGQVVTREEYDKLAKAGVTRAEHVADAVRAECIRVLPDLKTCEPLLHIDLAAIIADVKP